MLSQHQVDRFFCWVQRTSIAALLGMAAYITLIEQPPLRYLNLPFPVVSRVIYPGDPIIVQVSTHSDDDEDASYTSSRWLVNVNTGEKIFLPAGVTSVPPGDSPSMVRSNTVFPKDGPPGTYYEAGIAAVDGRFARNFKVAWRTQEFTVVHPGDEVTP